MRTFTLALVLAAVVAPVHAQVSNMSGVDGTCNPTSHLAEGAVGEDLTKRQSRFFCDIAVFTKFEDNPNHVLIQFTDRKSHYARTLGIAGLLADNGLAVDHFFLEPGHPIAPDFGMCKFFYKGKKMTGIWCASKIDERRLPSLLPLKGFFTPVRGLTHAVAGRPSQLDYDRELALLAELVTCWSADGS